MGDQKKKILTIEAIRGFSAIYVMLGHIVLLYKPYEFFPKYEFITKTLFGYGHQAVLLFFIVSGFSITYSSSKLDVSDLQNIKDYFFKRFRRIYPLFFIILLISLFVLNVTGTESDIKRNILSFFFLTDIATGSILNPIPTNYPIWSLSYEAVYYLLFPFMLFFWRKIGQRRFFLFILIISILAGIIGLSGWPNHIFNILQYYWIWIAGAMLADAYMMNKKFNFDYTNGMLISSMGFMITIEKLPIVSYWFWTLFFLVIFITFYNTVSPVRMKIRFLNFIVAIASLSICFYFTYLDEIVYHSRLLRIILIGIGFGSVILSFLSSNTLNNAVRKFLKYFVRSGSFSYALYIIHWPMIMLSVFIYEKFLEASFLYMSLLISTNILGIILLSWYLEEWIQPKIAKLLNRIYYKSQKQ